MSVTNLATINEMISDFNFNHLVTPSIGSLPVYQNVRIDPLAQYRIKNILDGITTISGVDDEYFNIVCLYILDEMNPRREELSQYLDDQCKEKLLEKYINEILIKSKCCYIDPTDYGRTVFYLPRINKIPLKFYNDEKIEITFDQLKDILLGKEEAAEIYQKVILFYLFSTEKFFDGPWLPEHIVKMKEQLKDERIDAVLDNHLKKYDANITDQVKNQRYKYDFNVDDMFLDQIINTIPNDLSLLEKSIYLYSKLCKIFTYDSVFFLDTNASDVLNTDNMDKYNSENNKIVCHNFAHILAMALKKIGITNIKEKMKISNNQFSAHSNIMFYVDDTVIFADSTRTVIDGDLEVHKFANELNGIRCQLYSSLKQEEFLNAKEKVLNIIKNEELMYADLLPSKEEISNLDTRDKYRLFNSYIEGSNFTNVDFLAYAKKLIDILELNVDTKVMYKKDDLSNLFLKVIILHYGRTNYDFEGERHFFEYIIDSNTKEVILENSDILEKESLTVRSGR